MTLRLPPTLLTALAALVLCPAGLAKIKPEPPAKTPPRREGIKPLFQRREKPPPPAPAPPAKKPAVQTQGDTAARAANSGPAPASPLIASPEELLSLVPATGPLGLEDLIRLAIGNSPQLQARRAQVATARAEKRAVQDFRNPELRLGYGTSDDNYLDKPYTERIRESYTYDEAFSNTETTTSLAQQGELHFGEKIVDVTNGTSTVSRFRDIERHVVPGNNGLETVTDHIIEDTRTETKTGLRERSEYLLDELAGLRSDAINETTTRTIRDATITETRQRTGGGGDGSESFNALLRFQMPHPWERRARIQRASAEVMLAEGQYLAEEDDVVRAVRALFYDLSLLEGTLATQTKRRESYTTFRTEMESANIPDFAMDAARATGEMAKLLKSMFDNRADIDRTRVRLASLCGLPGTDRIRTGGVIMRRVVDTVTLDPGYLLDIAMLYRSDAVASRARLEIAKANLAQAQAGKIPWVTFFDAGFARQWDERRYGREDEWFFRVGIEIPIFDLAGINQRSREYKKAAAEWEQQMEKQRRRIEVDISLALERLRRAGRAMREVESEVRNMNRMLKSDADKVKAAGGGLSDYAKFKRAQYDAEDNMSILQISRYEAYSKYNEALMDLEDVIGVRIEKALHGIRDK